MSIPGVVDVDANGNMYVADWDGYNPRVWVFDSTGTFRHALGAPGDGPGEFRGAPGRMRVSGDTVIVHRSGGLTYFSRTGAHIGDLTIPGSFTFLLILHRRGCTWTVQEQADVLSIRDVCSSETVFRETPLPPRPRVLRSDGGVEAWASFLGQTLCAVAVDIFCISHAGTLLYRYDHNLDSTGVVHLALPRRPITRSDRVALMREYPTRRYPGLQLPRYWPPHEYLMADDEDRLWIQLRRFPGDSTTTFWIVDPEAMRTAQATVAGDVFMWTVARGQAYGIRTGELGVRSVVRYTVDEHESSTVSR